MPFNRLPKTARLPFWENVRPLGCAFIGTNNNGEEIVYSLIVVHAPRRLP